jgi:hypothetical protein
LIGPLAAGIGTSSALYLCAGLEFVAVAALLLVPDLRSLPPAPGLEEVSVRR